MHGLACHGGFGFFSASLSRFGLFGVGKAYFLKVRLSGFLLRGFSLEFCGGGSGHFKFLILKLYRLNNFKIYV